MQALVAAGIASFMVVHFVLVSDNEAASWDDSKYQIGGAAFIAFHHAL